MVKKGTLIISTVVLGAFLFGMFAGVVGQVTTFRPEQVEPVKDDQGPDAPYGAWNEHLEETLLYLHSDTPVPVTEEGGVATPPRGGDLADGYFDYERPTQVLVGSPDAIANHPQNKRVILANAAAAADVARFDMFVRDDDNGDIAGFSHDVLVHRVDIRFKATCSGSVAGSAVAQTDVDFLVEVEELRFSGGAWQQVDQNGGSNGHPPLFDFTAAASLQVPDADTGMITFTGSGSQGNPATGSGRVIEAGNRLGINLLVDTPGVTCTVAFDSDHTDANNNGSPSFIRVVSNTARINTWVEDLDGEFTPALPSPTGTDSNNRFFTVQAAHASIWPNRTAFTNDVAAQDYQSNVFADNHFDGDGPSISNQEQKWLRIREVESGQLYYDERTFNIDTQNFPHVIEPAQDFKLVRPIFGDEGNVHSVTIAQWRIQYKATLPEANYRAEIYSETFGLSITPKVTVGLKAFEVTSVAGLTHEINAGESTLYRMQIRNTGGDTDTYTIQHSAIQSQWSIQAVTQQVTVGPGQKAEVSVRVTSPSSSPVGTEAPFTVTVSSSSPTEVPSQTLSGRAVIVNKTVNNANAQASLLGNPGQLEIFPGQQLDLAGLRIHNKAAFEDTYVFTAQVPAGVQGFTTKVTPPSRTVSAASIDDLTLTLRATESVQEGQTFTLTVHATRLGGTAPKASMAIPVEVVITRGVDLSAAFVVLDVDGNAVGRAVRDEDTSCPLFDADGNPAVFCPPADNDHDRSPVFRMEITNPGSLEDTYRLRGYWSEGQDTTSCSGNDVDGSGSPDWWRMDFYEDAPSVSDSPGNRGSTSASNRADWGTVTIGPGETVYRYVAMRWRDHTDSRCIDRPDSVTYNMRLQSTIDPTVIADVDMPVVITGAGDRQGGQVWTGGTHDVAIVPDLVKGKLQSLGGSANQQATGNAYDAADYYFRIVNLGNEDDNLVVNLLNPEIQTWSHTMIWLPNDHPSGQGNNTSGVTCSEVSSGKRWRCSMGIGDEATFRLRVQPPAGERVGRLMQSEIELTSGDDATVKDEILFQTKTLGRFSFEASTLKEKRLASPGSDVSLGFKVDNTGTQGDRYTISILSGDANWKPRISSAQEVFIPGQKSQTGFVMVTVPQGAAVGTQKTFAVEVDAAGAGVRQVFFQVEVISPSELSVDGEPSNSILLAQRGAPNTITVAARSASGPADLDVKFDVDEAALPEGWTVSEASKTAKFAADGSAFKATATFSVTPPSDALATSRVPLLVAATTQEATQADRRSASRDVIMSLEADAGIGLEAINDNPQTILPGGTATFEVEVLNDALAQDTIDLSHTQLPEGWTVSFAPAEMALGPLESEILEVTVSAPGSAEAGDNVTLALFGTSRNDPTTFESIDLWSVVGFTKLNATVATAIQPVQPDATTVYVLKVANEGNIPDRVQIMSEVLTGPLAGDVTIQASPQTVQIAPNSTKDILLRFSTSSRVPAQATIVVNVTALSLDNPAASPVNDSVEIRGIVFDYRSKDIDNDSIKEFAIDLNQDASDGFETFRESRTPGGKASRLAQIDRFLSNESRQQFMVQVTDEATGNTSMVFRLFIDGDKDGRADHFIDDSGDGLPNVYWDPDGNHSMRLTVFKDVDADNVVDYFVDTNGDGRLDKVFNVVTGRFTPLIVRDIDGDGTLDYAVDADGNGQVDADETVLFSRGGQLVAVQKVDVDGDGKLDEVYDIDGDGKPDYFIRNGETKARTLTLKDVNGDGVEDWLYDANGDGKDDSYYDPATKSGGNTIDSQASFLRMAGKYWYIPALFVLVLVLFIVLLAVTRR